MSHCKGSASTDGQRRRRTITESSDHHWDPEWKAPRRSSLCDRLCVPALQSDMTETPSPCASHQLGQYTPKCLSVHRGCTSRCIDDCFQEGSGRTTIRAENEVEAHKEANNYRFGFRKWKSHVTERPIEHQSEDVKELYSDLNFIKPVRGSPISVGNIIYLFLFGWWICLVYLLVCILMFISIIGIPYGKLCFKLACYFLWPFGKAIQKTSSVVKECLKFPDYEAIPEEDSTEATPLMKSSSSVAVEPTPVRVPPPQRPTYWCRVSTYVWLLLGFPLLALVHCLACFLAWLLVFSIPVAKMNGRTLKAILLMPPEKVHVQKLEKKSYETTVLLCCYHAFSWKYYKYKVDGINVFAVNLLPLVIVTIVIGYADRESYYVSSEAKFATAVSSIIPLSYYIGMGIASISAQSNFAVGAVVNATFGSITEMTFYITALLMGHSAGNKCYEEIVKAALTGTLLGCILFIPGICMIIGGLKHREQRFNSRSAGVSSALLFISVGVVHWSRLRALVVLIIATLLMAACADLTTENIQPILSYSSISQYFIGLTVLAMVPELPEIVNGIQFALQNNISLSLEVGSCIAVQVCMIQIPLLILFNAFYDVGFVLIFSDLHMWASIFSVILVNYIFMDGKCDYFQGTALVVVYLILLAVYFYAPSPMGC
ncbi:cation/H+ exchanger protein 1 isoform X2 [Alosa sapidissima]|uniref:cation/H+ exchanger protein 1 isoform X2 n=1 Tax=Alosa sapidissima TaxID=34773 RepID=UPI001C07F265|nr:cation/H+ exchanger protein 1 isoform X2 [Alosa sapidissima]